MTTINEIPQGAVRGRLRSEILDNVETRRVEANTAFIELSKFLAIIYSGGTIAILSFIGTRKTDVPLMAVISLILFVLSLLSFAILFYRHSQLHALRYAYYAEAAQMFFCRDRSLEELLADLGKHTNLWLYRLIFWIPFAFATLAFTAAIAAILLPQAGTQSLVNPN